MRRIGAAVRRLDPQPVAQVAARDEIVETAVAAPVLEAGFELPVAAAVEGDLAAIGVRVNTVLPGLIDTPIYGVGPESDAFKARLGEGVLFPKRLGFPGEYASLVLELLRNSYMNAESVRLDAGIRMPPK